MNLIGTAEELCQRDDDAKLCGLLNPTATCKEHGKRGNWVYSFPVPGTASGIARFWREVPHYHEDLNALRAAELALAPELREDYARELINELVDREDLTGIFAYEGRDRYEEALAYKGIYALITATAAQRAQALVRVLERVRGEVGA